MKWGQSRYLKLNFSPKLNSMAKEPRRVREQRILSKQTLTILKQKLIKDLTRDREQWTKTFLKQFGNTSLEEFMLRYKSDYELWKADYQSNNNRRITRSHSSFANRSISPDFLSIPETPKTQRKAKRGESLFSINGSPIHDNPTVSIRDSMLSLQPDNDIDFPEMINVVSSMLNGGYVKELAQKHGIQKSKELQAAIEKMKEDAEALLSQFE
jgi:hypothetical protein